MKIKKIVKNHLYILITNYLDTGEYVTKHTVVTFIPPLLHYLYERLSFNTETDYLYNIVIYAFKRTITQLYNGIYPVPYITLNWVNHEAFSNLVKQVINDVIRKKEKKFKDYNIEFEKNIIPINIFILEIEHINKRIQKDKTLYKKKIKKMYYDPKQSPRNFYE